ncbi:phosphate/phosphite/phosphonate ABC transporter substrate-binding protein [Halonotius sp. GCM10025705]|uniref:phosphate/phosphite/phosphonate ABC transporter substrate-binding protein n=1 Tax=Halonotius sp. GCM10025705 TaxID=3252678 RepID=UPI0036177645
MDRRTFLQAVGSTSAVAVAGCTGQSESDTPETVGEWAGDGTIEFGLPPFQDAEQLNEQYAPVFEWLADGFDGVDTVEGVQTTSYSATVESVVNGHTEMANLSPIISVLAREDGVNPLVINWSHGADSYHSYIATHADSDIDALEDIEGSTIAMVDPLSSSGGLFPRYMLAQAGLDAGTVNSAPEDFDIQWAGGHDASLAALQNGHVDAAAYGDFQHPGDDDSIVKVAESDPIPFDPLVAKPDTPDAIQQALIERLLNTPESALEDHRIDRFGEIEEGTYDPVRGVAEEMGVEIDTLDPESESEDDSATNSTSETNESTTNASTSTNESTTTNESDT